jgi:hypothetical protein
MMSLGYSIAATLQADFTEKNIKNILEQGSRIGCVYYKYVLGELNTYTDPLNTDEAVLEIYKAYEETEMYCITVEIDKTCFNLLFLNHVSLIVMIPSLNDSWSRMYADNRKDVDIERYMETFLKFVHDHMILELRVERD